MIFTMAAAGAAIKKIPWTVYAATGLLLLFWGWGTYKYNAGQKNVQTKWNASIERGKTIVKELKVKQKVISTVVETKYVDRVKVIHEKADVIYKDVVRYVPADLPDLPGSVRMLHDAAATNTLPGTSSFFDVAPIGVRDFTGTVVLNYEQYWITAERLKSLQSWVAQQRELSLETCKQPDVICKQDN